LTDYTIDFAGMDDIKGIYNLLYPGYFEESIYKDLTFDPQATIEFIHEYIRNYCFIAKNDKGEVVGVVAFGIEKTYYKEKECDVVMFYIRPDYRKTGLSRRLVEAIVKTAEILGDVGVIYTSCGSGLEGDNDKLYANLYKKYGFKELGTELVRFM